jgi:hypothetical protein
MESIKLEIAKKIADDFDLVKRCTKVAHTDIGHRKSSEPKDQEELEASLDLYLKHFSKILKTLE